MNVKNLFLAILLLIAVYGLSIFVRASQWEGRAEEYLETALLDMAKPWNVERLEIRASTGFKEKAHLKPAEIVRLADNSLGALTKIVEKPRCNIQQGTDSLSEGKHTFAVCEFKGEFEKTAVIMKIVLQDDGNWKDGQWKIHHFISVN